MKYTDKIKQKLDDTLKNIDNVIDDIVSIIQEKSNKKLKPIKVKSNENKKRV